MRTIEIQAYEFDELDAKAQQKAVKWWLEGCYIDLLDDEYYKDWLAEHGFLDAEIQYSGFCSQGDGASFTARIDKNRFLVSKYEALKDCDFSLKIDTLDSRYCHEKTKRVEAEIGYCTDDEIELIEELRRDVECIRLDLSRQLYRKLEQDYEDQTSFESVSENIKANEYEFTKEGERI